MDSAVMLSKITGWKLSSPISSKRASESAGFESGCLSSRTSVINSFIEAQKTRVCVVRQELQSSSYSPLHHHFGNPVSHQSIICYISLDGGELASDFCIALPCLGRFKMSPFSQRLSLHRRQMWSCVLNLAQGFLEQQWR